MKKKVKFLIITLLFILTILLLSTGVKASTYTTILDKDYNTDEVKCSITITSDGLEDGLYAYSNSIQGCTIINEDYTIYSKYYYNYSLMHSSIEGTYNINSFNDKPATISIYLEDLIEGDKYDVYFLDGNYPNVNIDENLNGTVAEVVDIDGVKYIQFTTTSMKSFALNQHLSNEYKDKLAQITENNIYTLNAANPEGFEDYFDIWTYTEIISSMEEYELEPIYDKPYMLITFDDLPSEGHLVKYKFKKETINDKIKSAIDEIFGSLITEDSPYPYKSYTIEDLNFINYLNNVNNDEVDIIYYSSELRNTLKGTNFIPYFSYRMGSDDIFNLEAGGMVAVMYDGILYPLSLNIGYNVKQVIYVPDNTENTDATLMKAAKDRITNYLGIEDSEITLTVGGTRSSIGESYTWDNYDIENISDNYYNLTINGQTVQVVIERNSEKAKQLEFVSRDLFTDVQITSESGAIPLDTQINVEQILNNSTLYKNIIEALKKENGLVFDLKLFSNSLEKYITKLDNGEFLVKIPLTGEYKNKTLSAYYINDDSKIEEYKITIEGDYAVFKTNHFSVYTIAERSKETNVETDEEKVVETTEEKINKDNTINIEETSNKNMNEKGNPKTGDNIRIAIIVFLISVTSIVVITKYKNKK